MKTLIINNGSKHISDLRELFIDAHEIIELSQIPAVDISSFDLIILSGSSTLSITNNYHSLWETEIELILTSSKPIIGICFGCELIAHTFGATLKRLHNKQKGIVTILPSKSSDIFNQLGDLRVYEAHRWSIVSLSQELEGLALSNSGIEIFRHKTRPIYGLQFHPEEFCDKSEGDEILTNIIHKLV